MASSGYGFQAALPTLTGPKDYDFWIDSFQAWSLGEGFSDIFLRPTEFLESFNRAKTIYAECRQAELANHSLDNASAEGNAKSKLDEFQRRNDKAAAAIRMRIDPAAAELTRRLMKPEDRCDAVKLLEFLKRQYDVLKSERDLKGNPEVIMLNLLTSRPNQRTLLEWIAAMRNDFKSMSSHAKFTGTVSSLKFAESILAKHVLDVILSSAGFRERYQVSVLATHTPKIICDAVTPGILDSIYDAVESVDFLLQATAAQSRPLLGSANQPSGITSAQPASTSKKHWKQKKGHRQSGKQQQPQSQATGPSSQGVPRSPGNPGPKVSAATMVDTILDPTRPPSSSLPSTPSTSVPSAVNFSSYDVLTDVASVSEVAKSARTKPEAAFLVDSGATHHCVRLRSMFNQFRATKIVVRMADSRSVIAQGTGDVVLHLPGGRTLTLKEVLYVPSFANNIISTRRLLKSGHGVVLTEADPHLLLNNDVMRNIVLPLRHSDELTWLIHGERPPRVSPTGEPRQESPDQGQVFSSQSSQAFHLLHQQLGHIGYEKCIEIAKQRGISTAGITSENFNCRTCGTMKLNKSAIQAQAERDPNLKPGMIIHVDIKGPVTPKSYNGSSYSAFFVDEATRVLVQRELSSKDGIVKAWSEAYDEFNRMNIPVQDGSILHGDAEVTLHSEAMLKLLATQRVQPRSSPPHTHERNGIVERAIQSTFDMVRALLRESEMGQEFWPIALQHAVCLRNRLPTDALGGRSPLEVLTGKPQDTSTMRVFGSLATVHVEDRSTLDPKGREGVYVGFDPISQSNRVLFLDKTKLSILSSIHCVIDESIRAFSVLYARRPIGRDASGNPLYEVERIVDQRERILGKKKSIEYLVRWHGFDASHDTWEPHNNLLQTDALKAYLSARSINAVSTTPVSSGRAGPLPDEIAIPRSFKEAMASPQAAFWKSAIQDEINSLRLNDVFDTVSIQVARDSGKRILPSIWVFTLKHEEGDDASTGLRYKARLVARGDLQDESELSDLYSPVANYTTVRTLLAVAALKNFDLDHMDVKTAFLNAPLPLDDEIYLHVPEGFDIPDLALGQRCVLKLKRSLYGLRQAPSLWNSTLHEFLLSQGLRQSDADPCLYYDEGCFWVAIWVDDLLVMSPNSERKRLFKEAICSRFKMRDLGPVKSFLGLEITRDRDLGILRVTATSRIEQLLEHYNLTDAKECDVPLSFNLAPTPPDAPLLGREFPYRALIGALLYVATVVRPDISYAVSRLASFQERPSQEHWDAAKKVLRYLKGTKKAGLTYSFSRSMPVGLGSSTPLSQHLEQFSKHVRDIAPERLHGFVDASWADHSDSRKSQSAFVFVLANSPISWRSQIQKSVALSSCEAEYISLSEAAKDAIYLRRLLQVLLPQECSTILFEDNQSAIVVAAKHTKRLKHVDTRYHFIREHVASGAIQLEYIPSAIQVADSLTKPMERVKVCFFREIMLGTL
jgi:hypothetical protein